MKFYRNLALNASIKLYGVAVLAWLMTNVNYDKIAQLMVRLSGK
jgi:hypothetical protein